MRCLQASANSQEGTLSPGAWLITQNSVQSLSTRKANQNQKGSRVLSLNPLMQAIDGNCAVNSQRCC